MPRQLTTSASDLVLAWSVVHFVYNVFWVNFFASLGLFIQGMAAAVGVARFAMTFPEGPVKEYHIIFSWLAQVAGLPLLGIGFSHAKIPMLVNLNFIFMIGVIAASRIVEPDLRRLLTEAVSGFGILTVIIVSLSELNIFGLVGACLYVVSGLVIGSEGYIGIIPRVDVLHYVLAVANIFFRMALV